MRSELVLAITLVALAVILFLTGCYQKVDQHDINKGIGFCGGVDNILYIRADLDGAEAVRCTNGETETWR